MLTPDKPETPLSTTPKEKSRSIAFLLTTSIILTVACVSAISISIGYIDATKKARYDLERNVERNIKAIVDILQVPLWTYDQETIEDIGNLYAGNEDIVFLTIIDSLGQPLFKTRKEEDDKPVLKTREVRFEGRVAGTVEMGLSPRKYKEAIRQLLWSGIITMVINLSVLILTTGFLLRLFLKNPLTILSSIVSSYASGNYANPGIRLPYIEFQPVVDVIRSMGSKILLQIKELKQAEQKFRSIFENAMEGIFQVSTKGQILSANPAMARIMGYDSPEEMMSTVIRVADQCFAVPEDYLKISEELDKAGVIRDFVIRGRKKNGAMLWLSASARIERDPEGKILYFEGSIFDISDRKEKEEAEKRQKAADAASQAKTLFIARMSHELRTPLNSVLGMTELLSETNPSPDQLEYIRLLQSSGEFLESIINDILDFSKIEAQQLVLDDIPFDLQKTLDDVAAIVNVRAREKNLPVTVSIDPSIHRTLSGDPVRLKQILINLGGNAVKFTRDGMVKIELTQAQALGHSDTCEHILFKVTDTGIGIPGDMREIIFDSFTQADSFIKRQYGGTGLGLSICKRLVELMGGSIGVESVEGEGSTFFFTLSLKKTKEPTDVEAKGPVDSEIHLPPLTILLADDIEPNRTVVHKFLKKSPVTLIDAVNGLEAYETFVQGKIDLILMDVEMPVMNGLEATRKIRLWEKEHGLAPTPLIVLSAHAFGEQKRQCYDAGCNDLLVKPIRKNDLVRAIGLAVSQSSSPDRADDPGKPDAPIAEPGRLMENLPEKVYVDVMFEDLMKGFFDYFEESLAAMNTAAREKDFDSLYRLGHGLKGSARNYEFFELGDLFFQIEKAAADKNLDDALHFMKLARNYLETVEVEFIEKE